MQGFEVAVPETENMKTVIAGPASRHSQFGPDPEDDADVATDDEQPDSVQPPAGQTTDPDKPHLEALNEHEVVIGVDPRFGNLCETADKWSSMQEKFALLKNEVPKLIKQHHDPDALPTERVAAEAYCKTIAVDLQEVLKKLSKYDAAKLDQIVAEVPQTLHEALAIPTDKPMSTFRAGTYPACYAEFFYGDACPFLPRPRNISVKEVFRTLQNREELQYTLPTDTEEYVAQKRSRFDTPEFVALFADVLRRMNTLQSMKTAFDREGFQKDMKLIAHVTSEQFLEAQTAIMTGTRSTLPPEVAAALRHVDFATALVPLTDGHKMRLRHFGHAINIQNGPLGTFSTHNYADTYHPLMPLLCESLDQLQLRQEPDMPTLQQMHKMSAASPRSSAKFWLLKYELSNRHYYGIDKMHIGHHYIKSVTGWRRDGYASSGAMGLAGYAQSSLAVGESQERGFEHCHDKKTSIPAPLVDQTRMLQECAEASLRAKELLSHSDAQPPTSDAQPLASHEEMNAKMKAYNDKLIAFVSTRQYESSVLPAKQLGSTLPPSPFSERQQRQSKYDGLLEQDGVTTRPLIDIKEEEPPAHIARDQRAAAAERRPPAHTYSELLLTGCPLSALPAYQLPQYFGVNKPISQEGEIIEETACNHQSRLLPWVFTDDGSLDQFVNPDGTDTSASDFIEDAANWEQSFGKDVRWLSGHNHNHTCATTCLKKMKKTSAAEKNKIVKHSKAPPCRFWFVHVVVLTIKSGMEEVVKKIRRRGKEIVQKPFIAGTNQHNEYGLVEPERPQPFRSPSSDVIQAGERCNVDFRIMARGYPEKSEVNVSIAVQDVQLSQCFLDVPFGSFSDPLVRRMAYTVVALHVAAHNCDYYITKYQSKALEQLQNLVTQYSVPWI